MQSYKSRLYAYVAMALASNSLSSRAGFNSKFDYKHFDFATPKQYGTSLQANGKQKWSKKVKK